MAVAKKVSEGKSARKRGKQVIKAERGREKKGVCQKNEEIGRENQCLLFDSRGFYTIIATLRSKHSF